MTVNKVFGIDLGTGNSCIATIEGGKPVVIVNAEGDRTTPSVVSIKDGERKVGSSAKRQQLTNPKNTIYNIKRFMGSTYVECEKNGIIKSLPYEVKNVGGSPRVVCDGRDYSPEEISSFILAKMEKIGSDYVGSEAKDVVITVPAWFGDAARKSTQLAGEMCGLNVLRIINEPTAALLASNVDFEKNGKYMVADIGQGTTDFSICETGDGVAEVKASKGSVFLGGADWDNAIAGWICDEFKKDNDIDLSKDTMAMQRIVEASEKAKKELSTSVSTNINIPYITVNSNGPLHIDYTLTRAKMAALTSKLTDEVIKYAKEALKESGVAANELTSIILVGGQSRSVEIQEALTNEFNVTLNKSVNPDEAVSIGAAIQANIIVGGEGSTDVLLLDVTPLNLGIETEGNVMATLIEANTTIPTKKSQIFTTAVDNQSAVTINVLQGIRPMASDNKSIGVFNLAGIMPAKRGVPQIEVTFDINVNGVVSVSAKDKATGKEQAITIESKTSLTDEEIERIKAEAEAHKEDDEKATKMLEKANKCESMIYAIDSLMESMKDSEHMTDDDKKFFEEKKEAFKKMKEEKSFDNFDNLEKETQERMYAISAKAYGQGQPGSESNPFNVDPNMFTNMQSNG